LSFRFTGPIYTFETVAEEVESGAGSLSLVSSRGGIASSLKFENKPWWENIAPVSTPPSPTLSVHSFSGFSETFSSPTTSEFSLSCPSPSIAAGVVDTRNVCWNSVNPQTAGEYLSIFGTSVFEDPFAWIRYPIPGPHDLDYYSDDDDDDKSAGYDWDNHNPTAGDIFDPFSEIDDVLALYCDSEDVSFDSYSDDDSSFSFDADEYSGVSDDVDIATTAETLRARYASSFLVESVVSTVKEVCIEDERIGSLDLIISSIF
jgi:hypothetical protein